MAKKKKSKITKKAIALQGSAKFLVHGALKAMWRPNLIPNR